MAHVIRVELNEAKKNKLAKRKRCDYCQEEKPRYVMDEAGVGGIIRNVIKLPNGTFRCVRCAFSQASEKRP